jgi:hypothetical protein
VFEETAGGTVTEGRFMRENLDRGIARLRKKVKDAPPLMKDVLGRQLKHYETLKAKGFDEIVRPHHPPAGRQNAYIIAGEESRLVQVPKGMKDAEVVGIAEELAMRQRPRPGVRRGFILIPPVPSFKPMVAHLKMLKKRLDRAVKFPATVQDISGNTARPMSEATHTKLLDAMNVAKKARKGLMTKQKKALSAKAGKMLGKFRTLEGEEAGKAAAAAREGRLAVLKEQHFEPIGSKFSQAERDEIFNHIFNHEMLGIHPATPAGEKIAKTFAGARAYDALIAIFDQGRIPQPNELVLLSHLVGPEFVRFVLGKQPTSTIVASWILEAMMLPKSLKSGLDISAVMRQSYSATLAHPRLAYSKVVNGYLPSVFSERVAAERFGNLVNDPLFQVAKEAGVHFASPVGRFRATGVGKVSTVLTETEEAFMSVLPQRIAQMQFNWKDPLTWTLSPAAVPIKLFMQGIRGSERGYVTYLNEMRMGLFKGWIQSLQKTGDLPANLMSDAAQLAHGPMLRNMATSINSITGRGPTDILGRTQFWTQLFFSPRLISSRATYIYDLLGRRAITGKMGGPAAQKLMALETGREVIGTTALVFGTLAAANLAAQASGRKDIEVVIDPFSSDFGKLRIGASRIDLTGGHAQPIRILTQILARSRRDLSSGKMRKADPLATLIFSGLAFKAAPTPGAILAVLKGEGIFGEELTGAYLARQLLTPIVLENLFEASKEHDAWGVLLTFPEQVGLNVTTHVYRPDEEDISYHYSNYWMAVRDGNREKARLIGRELLARGVTRQRLRATGVSRGFTHELRDRIHLENYYLLPE